MAEEKDDMEKTEEPSQYRIEEFRKKGEVAFSKELSNVLLLSVSFLTVILSGVFIFEELHGFFIWIEKNDYRKLLEQDQIQEIFAKIMKTMLVCSGPVLFAAFVFGIISSVSQFGFIFSPEVLSLKIERLNPIKGFKKIASMRGIAEVVKGLFKFGVILSISYFMMSDFVNRFSGFLHVDFVQGFSFGKVVAVKLVFSIIAGLLIVALLDLAWEKYQYRKKLMQTKQEVKQESKEKEGNPEIKQRIRSIQREMAQKKMMAEVPKADVIVTNPTHISIALKYNVKNMVSPEVIAKGADHLAFKIREIAKEHDIPLVENKPLARTLYKTVKLGDPIPKNLYKAVADILAFVYRRKRKKIEAML